MGRVDASRTPLGGEAQSKGAVMENRTRLVAILKLAVIFALVTGTLGAILVWLTRTGG